VPAPPWGDRPINRDLDLTVRDGVGSGTVAYDLPGVDVGSVEYAEGPTGVTVISIPAGARMAIDARGGAIGMSNGYQYHAHAIALAGGSVYGLSAGSGVADELRFRDPRGQVSLDDLVLVSTAVVYDFAGRDNSVIPDAALGRAAVRAARHGSVPVGRCGPGATTSAGKLRHDRSEYAGQGAAFRQAGAAKVLVITVVNSMGVVLDRDGRVVRGNYDPDTGERGLLEDEWIAALEAGTASDTISAGTASDPARGNTTITAVVTNVRLPEHDLVQFARQVHGSMNRAIRPFATAYDGDVLFALTTDEVDPGTNPDGTPLGPIALGALASETAWDAVLEAVR
jgi:L-aminopeptidase/D-esterase-like protein